MTSIGPGPSRIKVGLRPGLALRRTGYLGLVLGPGWLVVALSRSVRVPTRSRRLLPRATTVLTVALLATWPLVGHSAVGDGSALAIAANLVHTFAMTLWLGGLVLVLVSLSAAERATDLAQVLPRFWDALGISGPNGSVRWQGPLAF